MTGFRYLILPLLIIAAGTACSLDRSTSPALAGDGTDGNKLFTDVRLDPAIVSIEQGAAVHIEAIPIDNQGLPIASPFVITYSSDAPTIASVSNTGIVTALAPGAARIAVTVAIGNMKRTTLNTTLVFRAASADTLVATLKNSHWSPAAFAVSRGRAVQFVDSVDASNETVTRLFNDPGIFRYCGGACEDASDFISIYVR